MHRCDSTRYHIPPHAPPRVSNRCVLNHWSDGGAAHHLVDIERVDGHSAAAFPFSCPRSITGLLDTQWQCRLCSVRNRTYSRFSSSLPPLSPSELQHVPARGPGQKRPERVSLAELWTRVLPFRIDSTPASPTFYLLSWAHDAFTQHSPHFSTVRLLQVCVRHVSSTFPAAVPGSLQAGRLDYLPACGHIPGT